jgi:hypothetical protein
MWGEIYGRALYFWRVFHLLAWRWLVILPVGLLGALQALRDEFLDAPTQEKLRVKHLLSFLPDWPWERWALGFAAMLILFILEAAYRLNIRSEAKAVALERKNDFGRQLTKIADNLLSGHELMHRKIDNEIQVEALESEYTNWLQRVYNEIEQNISRAVANAYITSPSLQSARYSDAFNDKHNDIKINLDAHMASLSDLILRFDQRNQTGAE